DTSRRRVSNPLTSTRAASENTGAVNTARYSTPRWYAAVVRQERPRSYSTRASPASRYSRAFPCEADSIAEFEVVSELTENAAIGRLATTESGTVINSGAIAKWNVARRVADTARE